MKYLVSYVNSERIRNAIVEWEDGITENNISSFESNYCRGFGDPYNVIIAITKIDN